MERFRNVFLYPEKTYKNLTGKFISLIPGIAFVGLADIAIPYLAENFNALFSGADTINLIYNICMSVLTIAFAGTLDIALFCIPLFDIFNILCKEGKIAYSNEKSVRLMKIYVLAHLPVIPLQSLLYFITRNASQKSGLTQWLGLLLIISLLLTIWFNSIISRGTNILYNFQPLHKKLVFPFALIWGYILGTGMNYVLDKWLLKLFRL